MYFIRIGTGDIGVIGQEILFNRIGIHTTARKKCNTFRSYQDVVLKHASAFIVIFVHGGLIHSYTTREACKYRVENRSTYPPSTMDGVTRVAVGTSASGLNLAD